MKSFLQKASAVPYSFGLDILHPIQPEAMDILFLKKEFGKDLCFCGGVPTQDLLVRGSPKQVRAEVQRQFHQRGAAGPDCNTGDGRAVFAGRRRDSPKGCVNPKLRAGSRG
jgi:hypothetical protein